jgi:hypothetical protein
MRIMREALRAIAADRFLPLVPQHGCPRAMTETLDLERPAQSPRARKAAARARSRLICARRGERNDGEAGCTPARGARAGGRVSRHRLKKTPRRYGDVVSEPVMRSPRELMAVAVKVIVPAKAVNSRLLGIPRSCRKPADSLK